jgi:hypothetical protein
MFIESEEEVWLPVNKEIGSPINIGDFYQVSNLGRIRDKENKIVNVHLNKRGYLSITLHICGWSRTYKAHRLVASTFIADSNSKDQVNHKNGNKRDNSAKNLEWVSREQNMRHAIETGLIKSVGQKLNPTMVVEIMNKKIAGTKRNDLAKEYGVSPNTIKAIVAGKIWKSITNVNH